MNISMGMMTVTNTHRPCRTLLFLIPILLLSGCAALPAPEVTDQKIYMLEAPRATRPAQVQHNVVLAVDMPQARPGTDTPRIAYVQQPHELNYFVTSRWVDTPARMLQPLLVQAIEQSGGFRAVVQIPAAVPAQVRLDTELIRLQQDFLTRPSRVQLTLRAQLIDVRGQRVLAVKQFDESENAASDDAYGGVTAANRALQKMLDQLVDFCVNESVIQ